MPSISISNPESITNLNLGSATPKLGGALKLDRFSAIQVLDANNLDLTSVSGQYSKTTFTSVDFSDNKITGDLHKFENSPNCTTILLNNNNYDGAGYSVLPTNIQVFRAHNNNLKRLDTGAPVPNFSLYTSLAEYDVSNQSDSFGVSQNSFSVSINDRWGGAGSLTNTATTADSGAIPESMRILDLSNTHISKDSKRILLTQLYDTFEGKGTNWAKTTSVNGVTYNGSTTALTPRLDVTNDRGVHTGNLLGGHSSVTIADAIDELEDVGFTVNGFN